MTIKVSTLVTLMKPVANILRWFPSNWVCGCYFLKEIKDIVVSASMNRTMELFAGDVNLDVVGPLIEYKVVLPSKRLLLNTL